MRSVLTVLVVAGCGFHAPSSDQVTGDGGIDSPAVAIDAPESTIDAPPDAPPGTPCANGVQDGNELGVDCGGGCPSACSSVFAPDPDTLAIFELDGNLNDSSGNNRNATLIGGGFAATSWGMGLAVTAQQTQGFQWSAYASLLVHPFTVEIVVTPTTTGCYKKLLGGADNSDAGWYYCSQFMTWSSSQNNTKVGPALPSNQRHYWALVSTSTTQMDVYLNGTRLGSAPTRLANPPTSAIFFRDDTVTNRNENVNGVIDAVRISRVARSQAEITAIDTKLDAQP